MLSQCKTLYIRHAQRSIHASAREDTVGVLHPPAHHKDWAQQPCSVPIVVVTIYLLFMQTHALTCLQNSMFDDVTTF